MKGIDISSHNGTLDFKKLKNEIDFVIVRAGYGTKCYDGMAHYNISECNKHNIPVGAYWFSYAHTMGGAEEEAKNCCEFLKQYKIDLPVAFDFEYDSESYIKKWYGVNVTSSLICNLANSFLETVKKYGYKPMLYTNIDFLNRGFKNIINNQALWLAQWGTQNPTYPCFIWQRSDKYRIDGFNCNFDFNYMYAEKEINNQKTPEAKKLNQNDIDSILTNVVNSYYPVALDVLSGKYGNGQERKVKLREAGYDPIIVQCIVNKLV